MAKHCSNCATVNNDDVKFCKGCGADLAAATLKKSGSSADMIACPSCGQSNKSSSKFCGRCGIAVTVQAVAKLASLERPAPAQPHVPPTSNSVFQPTVDNSSEAKASIQPAKNIPVEATSTRQNVPVKRSQRVPIWIAAGILAVGGAAWWFTQSKKVAVEVAKAPEAQLPPVQSPTPVPPPPPTPTENPTPPLSPQPESSAASQQPELPQAAQVPSVAPPNEVMSPTTPSNLKISTAGLGDAKFGMDSATVERLIGQQLLFSEAALTSRLETIECAYAKVNDLPGVTLRFEKGRFTVAIIDKPTVTTLSGLKVGDPEGVIIEKLRNDPTYRRVANHYNDKIMEITVGKADYVNSGSSGEWKGTVAKFTAEIGQVTKIEAGVASYINLVEHEESCK